MNKSSKAKEEAWKTGKTDVNKLHKSRKKWKRELKGIKK